MRAASHYTSHRTSTIAFLAAALLMLPIFVDAAYGQRGRDNAHGQSRGAEAPRQVQRAAPTARAPQRQSAPAPARATNRASAPRVTVQPQQPIRAATPRQSTRAESPARFTPRQQMPSLRAQPSQGDRSASIQRPSTPRMQVPSLRTPRNQTEHSAGAAASTERRSRMTISTRRDTSRETTAPQRPQRTQETLSQRRASDRAAQSRPSRAQQERPAVADRFTRNRTERTPPDRSERAMPSRSERSESTSRFGRPQQSDERSPRSTRSARPQTNESTRGSATWRSSTREETLGNRRDRTQSITSDRTNTRSSIVENRGATRQHMIEQRRNRSIEARSSRSSDRTPLSQYTHSSRRAKSATSVTNIANVTNVSNVTHVSTRYSARPTRIIHRPIYSSIGYGYYSKPRSSLLFSISSSNFSFAFGHSWGAHYVYKPRHVFCPTTFRFVWSSSPYWYSPSCYGWYGYRPWYACSIYPSTHIVYRPITTTIVVPKRETRVVYQDVCTYTHRQAWEFLAQDQLAHAQAAFECLAREHPYDGITHVGWSMTAALAGNPEQSVAIMRHAARTEVDSLRHVPADHRLDELIIHLIGAYADRIHEPGQAADSLFMVAALRTVLHDASSAHFAVTEAIRHGDEDASTYQLRDLLTTMLHEELFSPS